MTKDEALTMCLEYIETDAHERKYVRHAIKAALEQAEPPPEWEAINNIIAEYGLQAIDFVADWKAAQRKPLTDEEIARTAAAANIEFDADYSLSDQTIYYIDAASLMGFARAIEVAHGIKEKNK